ncbi:hypothetical protein NW762_011467 [Fusarium torreyae]|uniref:Uncharacterized protein n=1 Tax=Fusarium torreyae TaxID=1237075 RepID=A0A9W8VCD1_9HYPO|nr:hypothetical protein NW762_011467 [Fusarium torreyae]
MDTIIHPHLKRLARAYNDVGVIRISAADDFATKPAVGPEVEHIPVGTANIETWHDDEFVETLDDWYLTDLRTTMGKYRRNPGMMRPVRPDNTTGLGYENYATGMPFHPPCFEVYKRASLNRYGFIDIDGLMQWFYREVDSQSFYKFPRHTTVMRGGEHKWLHNMGDEFLAANPCFVPGLQDILDSVQDGSDFDKGPTIDLGASTPKCKGDILSKLPQELKLEILLD